MVDSLADSMASACNLVSKGMLFTALFSGSLLIPTKARGEVGNEANTFLNDLCLRLRSTVPQTVGIVNLFSISKTIHGLASVPGFHALERKHYKYKRGESLVSFLT